MPAAIFLNNEADMKCDGCKSLGMESKIVPIKFTKHIMFHHQIISLNNDGSTKN